LNKLSCVLIVCLSLLSLTSQAVTVTTNKGPITRLYAYDDYGKVEGKDGAAVFIYMNTGVSACPASIYMSPRAPGYKNLVSFVLAAYMAGKQVSFQVYDDVSRQLDGRCEVDAIRLD